jgi:hypothetical protein
MSGVLRKNNIHVAVEARAQGNYGFMSISGVGTRESNEAHLLRESNRIVAGIRRHIDDIEGVAVVYDRVVECEFCDEEWEGSCTTELTESPGEPLGMPICCDTAQEEWWRENIHLWPEASKHDPWAAMPGWPWETPPEDNK